MPGPAPELPLVLKPRFGSWGRDVVRCSTADELAAGLAALSERPWFEEHGVLAQEPVEPVGWALRVVVAGGRSEAAAPPPLARRLALEAAKAVRGDLVGVDLLPTAAAYVVAEVNGAVDFHPSYGLGFGLDDPYVDAVLALVRVARGRLAIRSISA